MAEAEAAPAEEEDDDVVDLDEELHPDDVEEALDVVLRERTVAAGLEDEEDEEEEPDDRGEGTHQDRAPPARASSCARAASSCCPGTSSPTKSGCSAATAPEPLAACDARAARRCRGSCSRSPGRRSTSGRSRSSRSSRCSSRGATRGRGVAPRLAFVAGRRVPRVRRAPGPGTSARSRSCRSWPRSPDTGRWPARASAGSRAAGFRSPWLTAAVWVLADAVVARFPLEGFSWGEVGYALHDVAGRA